jgi:hypothetical protein
MIQDALPANLRKGSGIISLVSIITAAIGKMNKPAKKGMSAAWQSLFCCRSQAYVQMNLQPDLSAALHMLVASRGRGRAASRL